MAIAVVETDSYDMRATTVVFADLRGVGLWPQWIALNQVSFDTVEYIDGLQLPRMQGWSVVIYGGRRRPEGHTLDVADGETLSFVFRYDEEITPTGSDADEDGSDGDEADSDNTDREDAHTSTSRSQEPEPEHEEPRGPPPPRPVNEERSRSPKEATARREDGAEAYHRGCEELVDGDAGKSTRDIQLALRRCLAEHPLYPTEEQAILDRLRDDVRLLQADVDFEPDYPHAVEALNDVQFILQHDTADEVPEARGPDTFKEFERVVKDVDWSSIVIECQQQCGTRDQVLVTLGTGWEAENPVQSGAWELSAALSKPISVVPGEVRRAWDKVLEARTAVVSAPKTFWSSPFAVPFRALRASASCN